MLARDFWTDRERGRRRDRRACETRRPDRRGAERRLRDALVPPADRLLRLLSGLEGGVKFLVDLRADVLRVAERRRRAHRPRPRAQGPARHAVRRRAAGTSPHHLGRAGRAAREVDRVRSGARDRLVGRPEEPARLRPPVLRVLPPRDAERAARLRRDRAHRRDRRPNCSRCSTRARPTSTSIAPTPRSSIRSPTVSPGSPA